jgi:tetratricopeptide (TPR) repeat protein
MSLNETRVLKTRIDDLGNDHTKEDIVEFIDNLPETETRAWELNLTRLVERVPGIEQTFQDIIDDDGFNTDSSDDSIRFAAFFGYCTFLRRQKNITEFEDALTTHQEFSDHPMYYHLRALFLKRRGRRGDFSDAIENARKAATNLDGHAGVEHSLASSIIFAIEEDIEEKTDELLDLAEESIKNALRNSDYPKFYATQGRLLALQGEYERAKKSVRTAMDKEDISKQDYPIRISEYQQTLSRIYLHEISEAHEQRIDEAIDKIDQAQDKSEKMLEDLQTRTLQFLGFFAALLAVIVTSVQITVSFAAVQAAQLILILVGGLLCSFSGLSFILPHKKSVKRGGIVFILGIILISFGFVAISIV